jgi:hypothetical protein
VSTSDSTAPLTPGEVAFEEYLRCQEITDFIHEKDFPGKSKHPDYAIRFREREFLFELKDINTDPPPVGVAIFWDPHAAIREKIDQARKKFKEFKEYPCSLVTHVTRGLARIDDPVVVFGAMHGNLGFQFLVDTEKGRLVPGAERQVFMKDGRMTRPHWTQPQNTTINAVIALRHIPIGRMRFVHEYLSQFGKTWTDHIGDDPGYDQTELGLGVVVFENPDATLPLPRDIFAGRFDERWGPSGDHLERIFAGGGVLERDRIDALAKENARPRL